jgi:hypothetical protein
MANDLTPIDTVRRRYVDSGVFRSFAETKGQHCEFRWINDVPMKIAWSARSQTLQFKDVLPDVAPKSRLDREIRLFLQGRFDPALPEHRRLEADKVSLNCVNRGSRLSIGLKILDGDEEYGARKLVNLVHEVFVFLDKYRPEYVHRAFDIPYE